MSGAKILKRENLKDGDWVFLHREPGGAQPRVIDGVQKRYAMKARDFFSDVLSTPVSDTDCVNSGVENLLMRTVGFRALSPVVGDVDRVVTTTDMIVGAYTVANASAAGGVALNVTVTVTQVIEDDTEGTLDIVGTDIDDQVITEELTPVANSTVQGTQAFKTVDHVTGVGWVISGADSEDQITFGYGELIGLPDYMTHDTVLFAIFNNVKEGTAPTVTSSTATLALNTVDLNSALDGSVVVIYYLV